MKLTSTNNCSKILNSPLKKYTLTALINLALLIFIAPLNGQNSKDIRGEVNTILEDVSSLQDSIRGEISKISYKMGGSRRNQGFYLDPTWQNSFIITQEETVYHFSGRLNALNSAIEVNMDGSIRNIYPAQIKVAVIGDSTFIPFKGTNVSQVRKMYAYLEVLSFGSTHLLVYYLFRSQTGGNNQLSPSMNSNTNFKIIPLYYYIKGDGHIARLRTSKRKVLELFGPVRDEVESFVKSNRLRYSDKDDLTQIFDYFNGLATK